MSINQILVSWEKDNMFLILRNYCFKITSLEFWAFRILWTPLFYWKKGQNSVPELCFRNSHVIFPTSWIDERVTSIWLGKSCISFKVTTLCIVYCPYFHQKLLILFKLQSLLRSYIFASYFGIVFPLASFPFSHFFFYFLSLFFPLLLFLSILLVPFTSDWK